MTSILLSGFADEAAHDKLAVEQFTAMSALGLKYYSIRFIDAGHGIKNVMQLSDREIQRLLRMQSDFGLSVSSIGSPIGKVKLLDIDDGTQNKFIPFDRYLAQDVAIACDRAEAFGTKLIRGFSFYHPRGTDASEHIDLVCDHLSAVAEVCERRGLTFGVEVEANLVGQTGQLLQTIASRVDSPSLVTIFDGANLVTQGFGTSDVLDQYQAMKASIGWIHVKDYLLDRTRDPADYVDEERLSRFVPAGHGDSGYESIFEDIKSMLPELGRAMKSKGVPGVFCDLEPHLRGGGQFGGFSGPDGFGVALRALCSVLDRVGIQYDLRSLPDIAP